MSAPNPDSGSRVHSGLLSVIVPVHNEEENLGLLVQRVTAVLDSIGTEFELVFVDDGSSDGSLEAIKFHARRDQRIRFASFSRNFGHEAATSCGLRLARGAAAVIMDADLQDPPELIPEMIARWRDGYEVVYARRRRRDGESLLKRATARVFYRLLNAVSDVHIPEDVGDFRLVDRKAIDAFNAIGERSRFVRGLFAWIGFRQTAVDYDRPPRAHGETHYGYLRLLLLSLDAILSFSIVPIRIFTILGICVTLVSVGIGIVIVVQKLTGRLQIEGYALVAAGLFFLGGAILTFLGVVGEYVGRIFSEIRQRPLYIVRETSD